jgi:DNA gyrase subunit A
MVTKLGVVKKSELSQFDHPLSRGIIALGLDEGDELIAARLTSGADCVFLGTHEGMAVRFQETDVRPMGRPARGVKAMTLSKGDYIVGVEIVGDDNLILSISENGYGKRTPVSAYRQTSRGAKGVTLMKTTPKIGKVVQILSVGEETELMIITQYGKIIRIDSTNIRKAGRSTSGVILVNMEDGDRVAAAQVIPAEHANGNGDNGESKQGELLQ